MTARKGGNEGCVYKYDLKHDSWDKLRKYDKREFKPLNHGHAVRSTENGRRNELYVFCGATAIFGQFCLEHHGHREVEKIYDVQKLEDLGYWYPSSIFVGHRLHIFGEIMVGSQHKRKGIYSVFNSEKLQIQKYVMDAGSEMIGGDSDGVPSFYCCKVLYVEHLNEILLFNGHRGNVCVWSLSLKTNKFSISDLLSLPKRNSNNFDVELLHDRIVLILYKSQKELFCFDLDRTADSNHKNKKKKWTKKKVEDLKGINSDCSMVNVGGNYMHFITTTAPQHSRVWLHHLLPQRILRRVYAPMLSHCHHPVSLSWVHLPEPIQYVYPLKAHSFIIIDHSSYYYSYLYLISLFRGKLRSDYQ